ncbi:hypothetical protein N7474_006020 [Penicillium riverlandense]|uniref:uncharacterized protein n=1 Tax=Penicillium riverlandense TaxID=1903569 RepID=UPI00254824D3|nr:uncharacterized protein N7474_006020 [Penicillium riverlandense]KAJ5820429.1 hypothetical protein N7474_006020 [Penicillium riverlandense]
MKLSVMERDVPEGGPCGAGSSHSKPSSQISTFQIRRPVRQKMKASNSTEDQEESVLSSHDDLSKCDIGDEATSVSFPVPEDAKAKPKDKRKRASKATMTYKKRRKVKGLAGKGKSSSSHQLSLTMNPVIATSATSTRLDPMDITATVDTPGEHQTAPIDGQPKKSRGQKAPGRGKQMGQKLNLALQELVDEDSAFIPDGSMVSDNNEQPDNTFEPPSKASPTGSVFRGYSQLISSSDYAAVQSTTEHEATPKAFQQQRTSFQSNGSQEPFYTAYTDHFIPSSESTPESQRPLLATQSSAEETGLGPTNHRSMPKNSIVDQNGSPRLLPQENMYLGQDPGMIDFASPAGHILPPSNEAETTGAWGNFQSSQSTQLMCTFHREISLNYYPLDCGKKEIPKRLTEGTLFGPPLYLKWPPNASRPVRNDDGHYNEPEKVPAIAPEPMTPMPNYRRGIAASLSASSLPQQESSPYDHMIEWMASLQESQRVVTELMRETNECITHQLEEEREALAFVLDEYHEESLWALDRLFRTQQARMALYRESVTAMLQQQAELCMRLVWRLQGEE